MSMKRREFFKLGLSGASLGLSLAKPCNLYGQSSEPRFLITICGFGGASLIDSFLAISEAEAGAAASGLNCYPEALLEQVPGTPFRAVHYPEGLEGPFNYPHSFKQSDFVKKHASDLLVVSQRGTSVNHRLAQKRSLNGNSAWKGRTLSEAVATQYGVDYLLPNVNFATAGFSEDGTDTSLPNYARAEPVLEPWLWSLGLDSSKGLRGAPAASRIGQARALRDRSLDPQSSFNRGFVDSPSLKSWRSQREKVAGLEAMSLINRLNLREHSDSYPLRDYLLDSSPDLMRLSERFPDLQADPFQAQAALAFLLLKYRLSVSVTISPTLSVLQDASVRPIRTLNPPLAFDYSHTHHRAAQALMWQRLLMVADGLIDLLKEEPYGDGGSLWDRSLIYFATEFGRTKSRPEGAQSFGSAHDLNNGYALLSPLLNGNRVLGGVEPTKGLTYGFDPEDPAGIARPETQMSEKQIYAGMLHALGVDTSGSGLPQMRAMRKKA